jgi:O-antigen/teichoic acid export membrane protein
MFFSYVYSIIVAVYIIYGRKIRKKKWKNQFLKRIKKTDFRFCPPGCVFVKKTEKMGGMFCC